VLRAGTAEGLPVLLLCIRYSCSPWFISFALQTRVRVHQRRSVPVSKLASSCSVCRAVRLSLLCSIPSPSCCASQVFRSISEATGVFSLLPSLKSIQVSTFTSGLVVRIVAGTHPGLTLESPDQRLEDLWFKSFSRGDS
jgi:hypothetical protein